MELPEEGGIEPDYCFYIERWQAVVGRDRLNWRVDPPPDLVIELDVTAYSNVTDYLPYRVPEVWLFKKNQLAIHRLQEDGYQLRSQSHSFPEIDLQALLTRCLQTAAEQGTGVAIRELRQSHCNHPTLRRCHNSWRYRNAKLTCESSNPTAAQPAFSQFNAANPLERLSHRFLGRLVRLARPIGASDCLWAGITVNLYCGLWSGFGERDGFRNETVGWRELLAVHSARYGGVVIDGD